MKTSLFAVFAAALLAAGPAHADDLKPMKFGMNKLGAMTSVYVAAKTGIFQKHGLDLKIVDIPLSDQSIPLLQSKSVDVVLMIPGTAMVAKEAGFDVVLIGQNETAGTAAPVSNAILVAADSPIHDVAGLRSKKIGISSTHGQGFAAFREVLQRAGLSIDDVKFSAAPFSASADLLRTKQVDAAVTLDPYTTQILTAGYGKVISYHMIEAIPDQPVGSWWALRGWAAQHPQEIAAFNDAIAEAHAYLYADPERAKKAIADYSGLDYALVKEMPMISWDTKIDRNAWQAVADMMYRQGELTSRHDVSEYLVKSP